MSADVKVVINTQRLKQSMVAIQASYNIAASTFTSYADVKVHPIGVSRIIEIA